LHKIVLQESGQDSERLAWLTDNYLGPLAEAATNSIQELQANGVTPEGDPHLIYNMIRVSSGTLIALSLELERSSNIKLETDEQLDALAALIVRIFLPGEFPAP